MSVNPPCYVGHLSFIIMLSPITHSCTDKSLLGINSPGSLGQSVEILRDNQITPLCFGHPDDNVTCEPPIVGNVQLLSSPVVTIGSPSATQVTIMDDDGK